MKYDEQLIYALRKSWHSMYRFDRTFFNVANLALSNNNNLEKYECFIRDIIEINRTIFFEESDLNSIMSNKKVSLYWKKRFKDMYKGSFYRYVDFLNELSEEYNCVVKYPYLFIANYKHCILELKGSLKNDKNQDSTAILKLWMVLHRFKNQEITLRADVNGVKNVGKFYNATDSDEEEETIYRIIEEYLLQKCFRGVDAECLYDMDLLERTIKSMEEDASNKSRNKVLGYYFKDILLAMDKCFEFEDKTQINRYSFLYDLVEYSGVMIEQGVDGKLRDKWQTITNCLKDVK